MSRALVYLIGLQFCGWLRFMGDNLKTVRGALLGTVGLGMIGMWLLVILVQPDAGGMPREAVPRLGPALLLLYCVATVVFSPHDRSIYFTPAEVQFLFTGPFTRKQILAYKVLLTLLVSLPTSFILGVAVRVRQGWLPAVALGLFLLMVFLQLFVLVLGLAGTALGATLHTRSRRLAGVVVGVLVAVAVALTGNATDWDAQKMGNAVLDSVVWKAIAWPLGSFFDAMVAKQFWPDLLVPALVGGMVNVLLILALFALDVQFEEASAAASANLYARIQRMQGKQITVEPLAGQERKRTMGLPMPPYLGGVGPVLWRQLMTAWRMPGRIGLLLLLLGGMLVLPMMARSAKDEGELVGVLVSVLVWLSVFLPTLVPFDFRGDIDRMAVLKTLPMPAWRLALGQVLAPTLLMTLIQWTVLGVLLIVQPGRWPLVLGCMAYAPAFNFYLVALDNLAFLVFPTRVHAATPGDFQAMGRNVLLMLGKVLGLVLPAILVGVGVVVALLVEMPWLWVVVAAPLTWMVGGLIIPMAGMAFDAYDAGRNAPA